MQHKAVLASGGKKKKEIQRLKLVGKEGVLVSIALCIRLQKEGKTLQG